MSAAKRRIKRKIAQLLRMDDTRSRICNSTMVAILTGKQPRASVFWNACMHPLGCKLTRMGAGGPALAALNTNRERRIAAGGRA